MEFLLPHQQSTEQPDSSQGIALNSVDLDADDDNDFPTESLSTSMVTESAHHEAYGYVAGYHIRRFIKCENCVAQLLGSSENVFVSQKLFNNNCTLYNPCDAIVTESEIMQVKVFSLLDQIAHHHNVSEIIRNHSEIKILFNFPFLHENCRLLVQNILLKAYSSFFICVYCKGKHAQLKCNSQQSRKKFRKLIL